MTAVRLGSREFLAGPGWAKAQPRTGVPGWCVGGGGRRLSCHSRAAAAVSPKSLLEMLMLGPHPRPTEEGALGAGLGNLHFNTVSSSGDLGANWQGLAGMQQRSLFRFAG